MYSTITSGFRKALGLILFLGAIQGVTAQEPAAKKDTVAVIKIQVTGTILDAATGKGIVGARISLPNVSASITDASGSFKINVPTYFEDLLVTAEGYDGKQIPLKGRKQISVSLLEEGYSGFQDPLTSPLSIEPMRNTTSASSRIQLSNEWTKPNETLDALLQGQVAGLNSTRRSGTPGVGANLFLRGYNSLYGTNKPLVIVDGMIYDVNDYGQSIIANNYTNPFALINVQDIDNVTVLKDAASIYGTKGTNGAIIITTSRAKQQATHIDFGAYTTYNQQPSSLPVMNADDYRVYLSGMLQSKGLSSSEINAMPFMIDDTTGNPDYYRYHNNTNWQNKVFNNSLTNNYFLRVTGGDNIATYALSVGYSKAEGTIRSTDMNRYNTRFNAAFNFSKRFTGSANLSFTFNEQNLRDQGISDKTAPLFLALTKAPFMLDREVNDKGVTSPNFADTDILGKSNPAVLINNMQAFNKYYRFSGSFKFNYAISKTLNASTLIGVTYDKVRENIFIPRKGVADDTLSNAVADSRLGSQVKRLFAFYTDTRLEYSKTIRRYHQFTSRLGLRYQHSDAEQDYALGFNSATDDLVSVQNGLNALRQIGGGIGEWNWMNTYFNAEYGFKNKLFLAFNAAADGSSRFGTQVKNGVLINSNHFAVLPSASLAWLLSSENFMADSKIDLFKLRLSWSMTGNDDIGNYSTRQSYTSQNLLGMQGLVRNGIPNPALQWETGEKFNAGVDVSALNDRLTFTMDFFHSKTRNMLVYENITGAAGFNTILTNNGSMQNTGLEATVGVRLINKKNLKWDISGNIATIRNMVKHVPGGRFFTEYAGATLLTQGDRPAGLFYGYVSNGVYSTSTEAAEAGLKVKNADGSYTAFGAGDIRFSDINGDKLIDENDRRVLGSPMPEYFGGFSNKLTYRRFQLEALFTFAGGHEVFNYMRYRLESASNTDNQLNSVINRWRAEGQVTNMPKATYGDPLGNSRFSNRWIEDGSYLRLRHASLSYALPVKGEFVRNATIYVTGTNLLTFTKYMGYDPEFSASPSLYGQGIDTGLDPLYRSATLGVKLGF
ncbi:MAG TPA: SusC/RagA family TonB-linked outer membrane protein [Chitinophagaceae bacterium]|nr:SusC/RagA family TonB-linked outer membrane protein [Chitinophagaceae bacterium]